MCFGMIRVAKCIEHDERSAHNTGESASQSIPTGVDFPFSLMSVLELTAAIEELDDRPEIQKPAALTTVPRVLSEPLWR